MPSGQIMAIVGGFVSLAIAILAGFNKLNRELKEARNTIGEEYIKARDLEEIAKHKADILGIPEFLERTEKQDEKLAKDFEILKCHERTLEEHSKLIVEDREHIKKQDLEMRMILKALLAVLRSLEQKGINHTTTDNIKEIETYIWKTDNSKKGQ